MIRLVSLGAAAVISLLLVDRPVAEWTLAHQASLAPIAGAISALLGPWTVLTIMAGLAIVDGLVRQIEVGCGMTVSRKRPWGQIFSAGLVALAVALLLKTIVGRARPLVVFEPLVLAPFTGDGALPSAQVAVVAAVSVAVGRHWPKWQFAAAGLVVIVALARVLAAEHWVSDAMAGGLVGWLCAGAVARRRSDSGSA